MRKKILLSFFALLILAMLMSMAGCNKRDSLESKGYTVIITYDYNGGIADSEAKRVLYYKPGQPLLAPGGSQEFKLPSLDNFHVIEGWYVAEINEDGTLKKDADGAIVTATQQFVFDDAKAERNLTLVAKWKKKPAIELAVPGADSAIVYPTDPGKDVTERMLGTVLPQLSNRTFFGYFSDAECTDPIKFPINLEDGATLKVYTKYLDGDVLIIRTKTDLSRLAQYAGKTVYFNADIDMSGAVFPQLTTFSGKIVGNGHKISNLKIDKNITGRVTEYGLFGILADGAEITDLAFENVNITLNAAYSSQTFFHLGFLAGGTKGDVNVNGIKFENCSFTVTLPKAEDKTVLNECGRGKPYEGIIAVSADASGIEFSCDGTVSYIEN